MSRPTVVCHVFNLLTNSFHESIFSSVFVAIISAKQNAQSYSFKNIKLYFSRKIRSLI